ncbi:hypothetical protein FALCPG4_015437 [Fusarium falciforme]
MGSINDHYQMLDYEHHFYPPGCWPMPSPSFGGEVTPGLSDVALYQAPTIDSLSFVPPEPEMDRFTMSHENLYLPPTPSPAVPTTLMCPRASFPIIDDDESKDTRPTRDDYVSVLEHKRPQSHTSSSERLSKDKDQGSKPRGRQEKSQPCDKAPEEDRKGKKALEQRKRKRNEALGEEDATRRGKNRERNRKAAAKCHQRKRETHRNLSSLFEDQERLHEALSLEKSILEGQLYDLRRLALDHAHCDGSLVQKYIQAEAINVVERAFCGRVPAPNSDRVIPPHGFEEDAPSPPPTTDSHNLTGDNKKELFKPCHGRGTSEVLLQSCI